MTIVVVKSMFNVNIHAGEEALGLKREEVLVAQEQEEK